MPNETVKVRLAVDGQSQKLGVECIGGVQSHHQGIKHWAPFNGRKLRTDQVKYGFREITLVAQRRYDYLRGDLVTSHNVLCDCLRYGGQ